MKAANEVAGQYNKAEKRKHQFFELAGKFRNAENQEKAKYLGNKLGRMVFGS